MDQLSSSVAELPLVSIVVMAYNEAASIAAVLLEIETTLRLSGISYELIVVDDGSTDATGRIAEECLANTPNCRVEHHPVNRGIGEVYRTGFAASHGDFVTYLPADGQFPASIIGRFVELITNADVVLGFVPYARRSYVGVVLSLAERLLYRVLFGRLPCFQGIMMFRRQLLDELHIVPGGRGWGVLMEIIVRARRAGKVIISEPTELRARANGSSKVTNLRSVRSNLVQAFRLWQRL